MMARANDIAVHSLCDHPVPTLTHNWTRVLQLVNIPPPNQPH